MYVQLTNVTEIHIYIYGWVIYFKHSTTAIWSGHLKNSVLWNWSGLKKMSGIFQIEFYINLIAITATFENSKMISEKIQVY